MGTFSLQCHPKTPALAIKGIAVDWIARGDRLELAYRVEGAGRLVLPVSAAPERKDDLWKTTCFELFLGQAGTTYQEFNFSPSSRWASYAFSDYRAGGHDAAMPVAPVIIMDGAVCRVRLPLTALAGAVCAGLTAVLEEEGGHLSYWALAHGDRPDFHRRSCFTLAIGAAEGA